MDPAVLLRAAVATPGRFPALAGVDLEVSDGEVVVLDGANGAGKTSVLRVCAGLLALSGGEGRVLGHDLDGGATAVRRSVGLLGHAPALYDELTVTENVRFALRACGAGLKKMDETLSRLGLGGRLSRTPAGRLSAGQRRRVALAVVAARAPRLWLLDEPHAGLDAEARRLLGELLGDALAAGASALVASHEPGEVVPLADRIVTMAGGRAVSSRRGARRRRSAGTIHVA